MTQTLIYLMLGGITGTFCRYFMAGAVHRVLGAAFPWGTMAVNLSGCLLIGFLAGLSEKKFALSPEMRVLFMTGFCGAFTTFSTFILETDNLLRDGEIARAVGNVLLSVVLGFLLFRTGAFLAETI